ncbi:tetratricopeptide repeat protein [Planctomycetaceae bacterium SH139]
MKSSFRRITTLTLCASVAAGTLLWKAQHTTHADEPAGATPDQAATVEEQRFDLVVREDIFGGFNGDEAAMKRGLEACDVAIAKDPKHAEALVWRGAGRVFLAGQAFSKQDMVKGMQLWSSGLQDMDKAVELKPEDIAVRIPRAAVLMPASAGAPEFMAKPLLVKAKADFEFIYSRQEKVLDQLSEHSRGELRMGLADVYRRLGETDLSRKQLEAIKAELPDTNYADRAEKWLATDVKVKLAHNCIGCHEG